MTPEQIKTLEKINKKAKDKLITQQVAVVGLSSITNALGADATVENIEKVLRAIEECVRESGINGSFLTRESSERTLSTQTTFGESED
jgi:hypothetical protein